MGLKEEAAKKGPASPRQLRLGPRAPDARRGTGLWRQKGWGLLHYTAGTGNFLYFIIS